MDRRLVVFVLVAFGFSWALWGVMIASQRGWVPFAFPLNPWGSFGPFLGALAGLKVGGGSWRPLFRSLSRARAPGKAYAFALLFSPLLYGIAVVIYSFNYGRPAASLGQWYLFFPVLLLIAIVGGPLGEEPGWRGFLLPALRDKNGPMMSAVWVGVLWFAWHLPLFWLKGSAQEAMPVWAFGLFVMAQSFLFSWLYEVSGGSAFLAVLYHTVNNTVSFCLPYAFPKLAETGFHEYVYLGLVCVAAVVLIVKTRGQPPRTQSSS